MRGNSTSGPKGKIFGGRSEPVVDVDVVANGAGAHRSEERLGSKVLAGSPAGVLDRGVSRSPLSPS